MNINTNSWNKVRYTLYTPIYDLAGRIFNISRQKSINQLDIRRGERVLLIGAGTGLDLEFLPKGCEITATDITPSMVRRIEKKAEKLELQIMTEVMDGQKLTYKEEQFDKIVLHLILAVIPDPYRCLQESERVLKPGGLITVFDKFIAPDQKPSLLRKALNLLTNTFFTDINRKFEKILSSTGLEIISNKAADFNGNFRIILLRKKSRFGFVK